MALRRRFTATGLGVAALALLLGGAGQARAGYAYSNLGPSDSFYTPAAHLITGSSSLGGGLEQAVEFTVPGAGAVRLTSAELALRYLGGTNALDVLLLPDAGGAPGTTPLETIHLTNLPSSPSLVTATSATDPLLQAGSSYWMAALGAPGFEGAWFVNNTGHNDPVALRLDFGSGYGGWYGQPSGFVSPAFRVSVDATGAVGTADNPVAAPEPASLTLLSVGALGLLGHLCRRRRPVAA